MSEILEINDLSFSYGANTVFNKIDLTASAGEVICLMGPNGCGKTTLIDCVMGLKKLQQGEVRLCGRSINLYKRHEIARQIAYVPQIHDVTFPYTVREIVLMGRTAYTGAFGKPTREDKVICDWAIERVGIGRLADKPYSRLSGGEVKLVLLARALGQKTPLMLLDEPTAHLDYKNELLFLETVVSLCGKEGITVFVATHVPDHAFYFDSKGLNVKAVMMADGENKCSSIRCCGKPDDVITDENIRAVYGVKARIITDYDENNKMVKRVVLLETA